MGGAIPEKPGNFNLRSKRNLDCFISTWKMHGNQDKLMTLRASDRSYPNRVSDGTRSAYKQQWLADTSGFKALRESFAKRQVRESTTLRRHNDR